MILNVELEEKSTGDFSVSGGDSTSDGALAEVGISERNLLGRGLYAKASVTYGQYARGITLSFVEPYLLDYRVAAGLDVFYREQLPNWYISYGTRTVGFSPRLGFGIREDLSLQLRYSLYQQTITLPLQLDNCNNLTGPSPLGLAFNPTPSYINQVLGGVDPTTSTANGLYPGCLGDGKSSLPVRQELANGATWTSSVGYSLTYNTLDNNKNPTDGLLIDWKQDFAGVGGDVTYLKSAVDGKYYAPLAGDLVGLIHVQVRLDRPRQGPPQQRGLLRRTPVRRPRGPFPGQTRRILPPPRRLAFAVSDGMGRAHAGEFASRIAIEKITSLLPRSFKQSALGLEAGFEDVLTELFDQVHRALTRLGRQLRRMRRHGNHPQPLLNVSEARPHLARLDDAGHGRLAVPRRPEGRPGARDASRCSRSARTRRPRPRRSTPRRT